MNNADLVPGHAKVIKRTRSGTGRVYQCQHCDFETTARDGKELREAFWDHLYEKHGMILKSIFMKEATLER